MENFVDQYAEPLFGLCLLFLAWIAWDIYENRRLKDCCKKPKKRGVPVNIKKEREEFFRRKREEAAKN